MKNITNGKNEKGNNVRIKTTRRQLDLLVSNELSKRCLLRYINALETKADLLDRTLRQNAKIVRDDEYLTSATVVDRQPQLS